METLKELVPFAKEMLSQRPGRGLLKVYLVGSVIAVLGTVIGLVQTVCLPFSSGEEVDSEMVAVSEKRAVEARDREESQWEELTRDNGVTTLTQTFPPTQRSVANRLHAS